MTNGKLTKKANSAPRIKPLTSAILLEYNLLSASTTGDLEYRSAFSKFSTLKKYLIPSGFSRIFYFLRTLPAVHRNHYYRLSCPSKEIQSTATKREKIRSIAILLSASVELFAAKGLTQVVNHETQRRE